MRKKAAAKRRADYVRQHHVDNGGTLTTQQLADMLSVSRWTIARYMRNEIAVDSDYVSPQPDKLTADGIAFLLSIGFTKRTIAEWFGVTPRSIESMLAA